MPRQSARSTALAPSDSDEDFDSQDDHDEEMDIGRGRQSKQQTYRAIPRGRATSTRQSDGFDSATGDEDDDDNGREPAKQRKPLTSAPRASQRPGAQQSQQQQPPGQRKTNWILWTAVGGLVLIVIMVGAYLIYNNSKSDESEPSTASSLPLATPSSTAGSAAASGISRPATASISGSPIEKTLATAPGALSEAASPSVSNAAASSTALEHVETHSSNAGEPTEQTDAQHDQEEPTRTHPPTKAPASASKDPSKTGKPSATQTVQATWYSSDQGISTCLSKSYDSDMVVHISPELYGDLSRASSKCGRWISAWNPATDVTISVTIEGVCESCSKYDLDFSASAFDALTRGDMELGIATPIQWWYTPKESQPARSIESFDPAAFSTGTGRKPTPTVASVHKETQPVEVVDPAAA